MKLTVWEMEQIVSATEWLLNGEEKPDRETKTFDRKVIKLHQKLKSYYNSTQSVHESYYELL